VSLKEGLRAEESIAELCRKEGINTNVYYRWSKDFLEAGRKRLAGDTVREAACGEVKDLRKESLVLKEAKDGIGQWIGFYNRERKHQNLGMTPDMMYGLSTGLKWAA
jgi:transposase-like protein